MAVIQVNIPDAVLPRVLDAIAARYGYSATLFDGSPNPETKAQFARRQIILWIKDIVVNREADLAGANARAAAVTTATNEVILT